LDGILNHVDILFQKGIVPGIGDDAGVRGMTAGQNHCVPWPCLGIGMPVLGFSEDCSLIQEPAKATFEEGTKASQVVKPHLIDRKNEDQFGFDGRGLIAKQEESYREEENAEKQYLKFTAHE
jgi:hypothetical protein